MIKRLTKIWLWNSSHPKICLWLYCLGVGERDSKGLAQTGFTGLESWLREWVVWIIKKFCNAGQEQPTQKGARTRTDAVIHEVGNSAIVAGFNMLST